METLELFLRLSQDLVVSPGDQLLVQADLQAQNMDGYESAFVQVRFYRKNFDMSKTHTKVLLINIRIL